jgi:hypothetical protein
MDFRILRQDGFLIEHEPSCLVPGYLVITPPADLARPRLERILAHAREAIRLTIAPEVLHCETMGEGPGPARIHLFPRTRPITRRFQGLFPDRDDLLQRPFLLHWARAHYRAPLPAVWRAVGPLLPVLREAFLLSTRTGLPNP